MTDDGARATIRTANSSDATSIASLLAEGAVTPRAVSPTEPSRIAEAIEDIVAGPSTVFVAERGGEVVGVCQLIVFRHLQNHGGWCAELESLHVAAAHRSTGIGGSLVEAAAARAAAQGCYRLQLTSNVARPNAHRFSEQHEFTPSHVGFKRLL